MWAPNSGIDGLPPPFYVSTCAFPSDGATHDATFAIVRHGVAARAESCHLGCGIVAVYHDVVAAHRLAGVVAPGGKLAPCLAVFGPRRLGARRAAYSGERPGLVAHRSIGLRLPGLCHRCQF